MRSVVFFQPSGTAALHPEGPAVAAAAEQQRAGEEDAERGLQRPYRSLESTSISGSAVRGGGDGSATTATVSATDCVSVVVRPSPKSTVTSSSSTAVTV